MKIIIVIPCRYGSSRFPGKPLAPIAGQPMIRHVYERAVQSNIADDTVVATDDERIFNAVRQFGGNVLMTSDQNRSGSDRVSEAAEKMGLKEDDIVINVQGDQPLIDPRCLIAVAEPFKQGISDDACEMTTLAFKIINPAEITNPKDVKVTFDRNGFALYFSRSPIPCGREPSQTFDTYKHLGVYAYTRRFLETFRHLPEGRLETIEKLEQLRVLEHGYRILVVPTLFDSPEVDLQEDIDRIEKLIAA